MRVRKPIRISEETPVRESSTSPYSQVRLKARAPEETVAMLKATLADLGLSVKESRWHRNPAAMSVRLDVEELPFGVNGKGVDEGYARASAYAELFERLQNISIFNTVFRSGKARDIALRYADQAEHRFTKEDLDNPYLTHLFADEEAKLEFAQRGPHVAIPFHSVNKNETIYIPAKVLGDAVGTNGMCAGNTATEAIIQGLCEIFERYALRRILVDDAGPPDIPLEYIDYTILERYVAPMENLGYEVYLKDCTLNGTFPVSRPLYMFTPGWPKGDVLNFINFVIHPQKGQKYVSEVGFVPLY